jgi:hypothetical protein
MTRIRPDPAHRIRIHKTTVCSYYLEAVGLEPPDIALVLDVQREVEHRRLGYHGTLGQEDTCKVCGTHRVPTPPFHWPTLRGGNASPLPEAGTRSVKIWGP